MVSIEVLSAALRSLAVPGMTPKALRAALRDRHPEASKKAMVRAAFLALIDVQSQDDQSGGCSVETLHGFALAERASSDDGPVMLSPRRRRRQRRAATEETGAAVEASVAA